MFESLDITGTTLVDDESSAVAFREHMKIESEVDAEIQSWQDSTPAGYMNDLLSGEGIASDSDGLEEIWRAMTEMQGESRSALVEAMKNIRSAPEEVDMAMEELFLVAAISLIRVQSQDQLASALGVNLALLNNESFTQN